MLVHDLCSEKVGISLKIIEFHGVSAYTKFDEIIRLLQDPLVW